MIQIKQRPLHQLYTEACSRLVTRQERRNSLRAAVSLILMIAVASSLAGCGVAAFPVRTTSAAVKAVPVAGHVVAYPLDKTADTID
ncbi:MAG: DUF6726 family protein [Enhydrobacter sp.]